MNLRSLILLFAVLLAGWNSNLLSSVKKISYNSDSSLTIDSDYYYSAVKTAKDPVSDYELYKLNEFSRLKYDQDQFTYFILEKLHLSNSFNSYLIAEHYDSEMACWLVNYSMDGQLIDSYEVFYDNAEGFLTVTSNINLRNNKITVNEHNIYEDPEHSVTHLVISNNGKFLKE